MEISTLSWSYALLIPHLMWFALCVVRQYLELKNQTFVGCVTLLIAQCVLILFWGQEISTLALALQQVLIFGMVFLMDREKSLIKFKWILLSLGLAYSFYHQGWDARLLLGIGSFLAFVMIWMKRHQLRLIARAHLGFLITASAGYFSFQFGHTIIGFVLVFLSQFFLFQLCSYFLAKGFLAKTWEQMA